MIRQILPIVVAACVAPCFAAEGWITDMDAAKKQAAEQKKDLMIEFTGSDWCPPCMQLRANVFSKPDFQKEASKDFVLVELDYPRNKEQSKEMKAANDKLAQQYGITEELLVPQQEGTFTTGEDSDVSYIQQKGTLVVGITEFAPMDYKDENGQWIGFDADMAKVVAEKLGVEPVFTVINWDNKVFELNSKNIDVVWNGMTLTDGVQTAMTCTPRKKKRKGK